MAAIGICWSGLVALAVAQGTPTTMLYQDLGGRGDFVHTATFLVSSEEALATYARHPWSQEGTSGLWLPPAEGNRRIGFGDRLMEFLASTYPIVSPASTGASNCATASFVRLNTSCTPYQCVPPGPCTPTWSGVGHIGCPSTCPAGWGCARTTHTVTSAVIGGTCLCGPWPPFCNVVGSPLTIQSFTTSGPLCQCVSPPPPCAAHGSGGGSPFGEFPLPCHTPPRIGTTFTVGGVPTERFLVLGQCFSTPLILPGCGANFAAYSWVLPLALFPGTTGNAVAIPVPNNPRLIGAVVCLQSGGGIPCLVLSETVRATVQP
jgi:hypothetical protein